MKAFLLHEDIYTQVVDNALHLANDDYDLESPLKSYNALLVRIDDLQNETAELQRNIADMLKSVSNDSTSCKVLSGCALILRERTQNISSARALVVICKENTRLQIKVESGLNRGALIEP